VNCITAQCDSEICQGPKDVAVPGDSMICTILLINSILNPRALAEM
jgi:hypothetical protein